MAFSEPVFTKNVVEKSLLLYYGETLYAEFRSHRSRNVNQLVYAPKHNMAVRGPMFRKLTIVCEIFVKNLVSNFMNFCSLFAENMSNYAFF